MLWPVERIYAKSPNAALARSLVEELQHYFLDRLQSVSREQGCDTEFDFVEWLRDEGKHGGGSRYVTAETPVFNRAAINVSGVHYDDNPTKKLSSADALSTIIHPHNPMAPSVHMHFSWTEMRDGKGYYRMMADLNPSIEDPAATERFSQTLREAAPDHYQEAANQGNRYFHIPTLDRHRGVSHFYLEAFSTGNFSADSAMAKRIAHAAIDCYIEILRSALANNPTIKEEDLALQRAYHTAYLFQVLTLDRGTTSGLLVHDQNDLGIMGSIPAYVDRELLASWKSNSLPVQQSLVQGLVDALEDSSPSHVTDPVRRALAQVVRKHYTDPREPLALQASGGIMPPTVANHSD